jgi:predicted ATP-grasp superfamily ATP-dependent carboligase
VVPDLAEDEAGYVAGVLDVLDRHPADVLVPVIDRSVAVLRRHREELSARTALALAAEPALECAVDKRCTLDAARDLGVAVPESVLVTGEEDLAAAVRIGFPCVVKPTVSWSPESARVGRLTCRVAVDRAGMDAAVRVVLAADAAALVQQWLPGRREAVHQLYAGGQLWAQVCVAALRTAPALGGDSVMRMTVPPPEDVVGAAERLVRELDLEGYTEVEFRRDGHGRPVLMEINPRLSASVETAIRAGVHFPVLLTDWARGVPLQKVDGYRVGVRLRWVGGELRWLGESWRSHGHPDVPSVPRAAAALLADTLRPSAYDLVDPRDPRPAMRMIANAVSLSRRRPEKRSSPP